MIDEFDLGEDLEPFTLEENVEIDKDKKLCSACYEELPKETEFWGLVWGARDSGICLRCLIEIRVKTGVDLEDSVDRFKEYNSLTEES